MADPVRIPITIALTRNCFTTQLTVGGGSVPVNVLLDTGSSMAAVNIDLYDPSEDAAATKSQLLMNGSFQGAGYFIAAVVQTPVGLQANGASVTMPQANLGIIYNIQPGLFGQADGILGLAYPALNPVNRMPANTMDARYTPTQLAIGQPAGTLPPYVDQLVAAEHISNKFAFAIQRSLFSQADDALNTGVLVLGGGEECTDLYSGAFSSVAITHESYYGTNLIAVQVGDQTIPVAPLPAGSAAASNSFLDSGASGLRLDPPLYQAVIDQFSAINPTFGQNLQSPGLNQNQLNLAAWPPLRFILQGTGGAQVTLTIEPKDYWQFDSYGVGTATTVLNSGGAPNPGQSILGLPLFAGHYLVFDRTAGPGNGVIKFATLVSPAEPLVA